MQHSSASQNSQMKIRRTLSARAPEKILNYESITWMFEVTVSLEGTKTNTTLMFPLTTESYIRKSLLVISFTGACLLASVTFNSGRSSSFSHAYRQAFACIIPSVLEKEIATHSSTLAWKIPWNEEPGRLQSMGSQRVGHD